MFLSRKRRRTSLRKKKLQLEMLESRRVFAGQPFGAFEADTAEFMLGKVAVTPVFLESNGQTDASTENWNSTLIQNTLTKIREGLNWWVDTLATFRSVHQLEFILDTTYADTPVQTKYEPISRPSNDYTLWVSEFLSGVGQSTSIQSGIRAFNHAQRVKLNTDWAITIFVVPSQNDTDGQFAAGGTFTSAFSFAGGLFEVVPSTQPAATYARETGQMFWARNEYVSLGTSYTLRRGYYNTPNSNAADNTATNFVQQPSIMATGNLLTTAFTNHVSPATTLAMVGWQDTDRDGIFDVLDVPLKLMGTGNFDLATNQFIFQGQASAQTLPNLNSEGFQNDITINRIRRVEYRIDGGQWQLHSQPNDYVANLSLSIPVPGTASTIEIRAVDDRSTVTSNVFKGNVNRAQPTTVSGISGSIWVDANKNGVRDRGEYGEAGWAVNLLAVNGEALNLRNLIEPDSYADGQLTSNFNSQLILKTVGPDADGRVGVFSGSTSSTGIKSFQGFSKANQSYRSTWSASSRSLQIQFNSLTSVVEIDAIGVGDASFGRLEVFNSAGILLERYTTAELANGTIERMAIARASGDIAFAFATGHAIGSVGLDNLRVGPETTVTTMAQGVYSFPSLPAGSYQVQVSRPDLSPLSPTNGRQNATVVADTPTANIDFGLVAWSNLWQNPRNRFNVNDDDEVTPLDALLVIDDLSRRGSRNLVGTSTATPPYIDVSGDNQVSPLDVLLVIDVLVKRTNGGVSEGENVIQLSNGDSDFAIESIKSKDPERLRFTLLQYDEDDTRRRSRVKK